MIDFPQAKINLGLNIVGRRPDGYHDLETVFYPVPLADALEIHPMDDGFPSAADCDLKVTGFNPGGDEQQNLVVRAYNLLRACHPLPRIHAHLHKAIPSQAGMGGGSSDCAAMLKLLNRACSLGIDSQALAQLAATLGADCGIGMAAQLAVLTSPMKTGRIEALFTVSEETGLDGANALKPDFISGKVLINLDSEDEGELFIGCAGGLDTTALFNYEPASVPDGYRFLNVKVYNAIGGHSGDDIDKGRANAVLLLARFLYSRLCDKYMLCSIDGGNKRNAIAREAEAVVAIAPEAETAFCDAFKAFARDAAAEFSVTDPDVRFSCEETAEVNGAIDNGTSARLITSLFAAPHGVLAMSPDIKGLVQTSTNLASVKMKEGDVIRVGTSQRSSIISEMRAAAAKVEACFTLAGATVTHESEYPGWKPDTHSKLLEHCVASYRKLFGKEPVVRAIHAGLECGLFLEKYPDLDMISFGPTLRGVHAPGERLDLDSLDRFVRLLEDVIVNY